MFTESELILQPDGSIYHLNLKPEQLADTIIVVGDQARVEEVSKHFDHIEHKAQNREIKTHTGTLNGKELTVMSTGMGPDNIDIVLNEMDALANIDLETRELKDSFKKLKVIRLGTSGAINAETPVNSMILSTHGVGIDGLLHFYKGESVIDQKLTTAFSKHLNWPAALAKPYIVGGSEELASLLGKDLIHGMTVTAPGFYGPQGRQLRAENAILNLTERLASFNHDGRSICNIEMETAALYGLGAMLGHEMITICVILANRASKQYSSNAKEAVGRMIELVLERLVH